MSVEAAVEVVGDDCCNLRQGDVVGLRLLSLSGTGMVPELVPTPEGVAILSQTCDVVQPSKARCLVAPVVVGASNGALSSARKGLFTEVSGSGV